MNICPGKLFSMVRLRNGRFDVKSTDQNRPDFGNGAYGFLSIAIASFD
jgi:hypothetical protein